MSYFTRLVKPCIRITTVSLIIISLFLLGYKLWTPGKMFTDGRHDLKKNGIWLQHGWLGHDNWFRRYKKNSSRFRNPNRILKLRKLLAEHNIKYLYPHLCPTQSDGMIAEADPGQTRQFLMIMEGFKIMPWIGGALRVHAFPESDRWRDNFIMSANKLLSANPLLAGIHVNIEPMPSGNTGFLNLLKELKQKLPKGKILSVAAYPPTIWQRTSEVHWDRDYYMKVARETDQMVIMMYDTGIRHKKFYQSLMASWTREVLEWSSDTDVLLGLPAYNDEGVGYHHPHVENLENSLPGIHAGLDNNNNISNYKGISIYCEWEMNKNKWQYLKRYYCNKL
ncbi:MAG: hypothetical protein GY795_36760 [Desulfobacterales bacterium]|nr:hypothetical protein [Desulfobacterales bacterium]